MPRKTSATKQKLTHIDSRGRASMVDVTNKVTTDREAVATGSVLMKKETLTLITDDKIAKGNVFEAARLAGIMAAKKTDGLIPLCHPLMITSVSVDFKSVKTKGRVNITAKVKCAGQTGVEMEALTAASVAALTIYDMCKAVDKAMVISDIMLQEKRGGKSGVWKRR
ncbi:MAG: cyclic pyranopterin monophosphate synthase MoaC [Nitrospira sp.]|nr:cyclic pyranopterin monophosphate synthase MoaC [Nitrospira sp.]